MSFLPARALTVARVFSDKIRTGATLVSIGPSVASPARLVGQVNRLAREHGGVVDPCSFAVPDGNLRQALTYINGLPTAFDCSIKLRVARFGLVSLFYAEYFEFYAEFFKVVRQAPLSEHLIFAGCSIGAAFLFRIVSGLKRARRAPQEEWVTLTSCAGQNIAKGAIYWASKVQEEIGVDTGTARGQAVVEALAEYRRVLLGLAEWEADHARITQAAADVLLLRSSDPLLGPSLHRLSDATPAHLARIAGFRADTAELKVLADGLRGYRESLAAAGRLATALDDLPSSGTGTQAGLGSDRMVRDLTVGLDLARCDLDRVIAHIAQG